MAPFPQQTPSEGSGRPSKYQTEYTRHINSTRWETRRRKYYATHPKRCRACGATDQIHLHHLTYKRMGKEHDDDLLPLCESCHDTVHKLQRTTKGMSIRQATVVVVGKPLKPPRQRRKPRQSLARQPEVVISRRKKPKEKPSPVPVGLKIGDRVVITTESKIIAFANNKVGTLRKKVGTTSWQVELDDMPGSALAVTAEMARPLPRGGVDPVNSALSDIRERRRRAS